MSEKLYDTFTVKRIKKILGNMIDTSDQKVFNFTSINDTINLITGSTDKSGVDTLLAFDAEFYAALIQENKDNVELVSTFSPSKNTAVYNFVREFGMLIFTRHFDKTNVSSWGYYGKVIFNVPLQEVLKSNMFVDKDLKIVRPKFATTTKDTKNNMIDKMTEYFNILNKDPLKYYNRAETKKENNAIGGDYMFHYDYKVGNNPLPAIHNEINRLYHSDPEVKKRTLSKNKVVSFISFLDETSKYRYEKGVQFASVVKGKMDFVALTNTYRLLDSNYSGYLSFDKNYDIQSFNKMSQMLYGNAKLETTCEGVVNSSFLKNFFKQHKGEYGVKAFEEFVNYWKSSNSAHDPIWDSACTFLTAVILNMGLYDVFKEDQLNKTGGSIYKYKYKKYKRKYLSLKN
jgi:hypothetical protein